VSFQPGEDNFNIISNDPPAMAEADRMYFYVKRRLGDDIVNVELTELQIFSAFEQGILEFSKLVNEYNNKSNLGNILGTGTGSLDGLESAFIYPDLSRQIMYAEAYASEAGVGGYEKTYLDSFTTKPGVQTYDLRVELSESYERNYGVPPQKIRVIDLYWIDPANQFATYDANNYIFNNQFQFGTSVPGIQYQILPVFESVLRRGMYKEAVNVRLSNYSYNIIGGDLILYPVPYENRRIWIRYRRATDPFPIGLEFFTGSGNTQYENPIARSIPGVSNPANSPFGVIPWSKINSIGQQWIRNYAFAVCKETLGYVRRKVRSGIPVPGDNTLTLDGDDLVSEGQREQERLLGDLKDTFDALTYDKLAEQEAIEAEALNKSLGYVPLGIWIG
jgi:hypothetical protein